MHQPRGYVFATTQTTEKECLKTLVFGTTKTYGPIVIRIRENDLAFLNNVNTDQLHGVFKTTTLGGYRIIPEAFKGRYPYQVKVSPLGQTITLDNADMIFKKLKVKRNTPITGRKLQTLLNLFADNTVDSETTSLITAEKKKTTEDMDEINEIPLTEATTLWDFPRQSYGQTPKGDNKYPGVTPALVIYNLVWRYTDVGDLVVDPMAGSGTTLDVCREEKRRCICYDIAPKRPDIIQADARNIPLDDSSVDMVFIDSPYGDNIKYNDHPDCIGKISCETEKFYDELEKVMKECHRILKPGKIIGWLIGDQWVGNKFTPVGFNVYQRLCKYFETVDIVCVTRRGQASHRGPWYSRARRYNFYLRGFKYLFIMRKPFPNIQKNKKAKNHQWTSYPR